jgi:hypothetical protein
MVGPHEVGNGAEVPIVLSSDEEDACADKFSPETTTITTNTISITTTTTTTNATNTTTTANNANRFSVAEGSVVSIRSNSTNITTASITNATTTAVTTTTTTTTTTPAANSTVSTTVTGAHMIETFAAPIDNMLAFPESRDEMDYVMCGARAVVGIPLCGVDDFDCADTPAWARADDGVELEPGALAGCARTYDGNASGSEDLGIDEYIDDDGHT